MDLNPDFEAAWRRLEDETAGRPAAGLVRLRLTAERDDGLYLALDAGTRRRTLLVAVDDPDRVVRAAPRWREVEVVPVKDPTAGTLVAVELANPAFRDVFCELASDLYRTLAPLQRGPGVPRTLVDRLAKWQRFLREHGFQGLGREEQRGLFGELSFLLSAVLPRLPGTAGVQCWRGPEGAPHDFRFRTASVEVKVTGEREAGCVSITNAAQLDDASVPALYLYTLRLERVAEGGTSLPALVATVRSTVAQDPSAVRLLDEKLMHVGYLGIHEPEYLDLYQLRGDAWYRVQEGFPRVVRPPAGVSRVRYDVSLTECAAFRIDGSAVLRELEEGGGRR